MSRDVHGTMFPTSADFAAMLAPYFSAFFIASGFWPRGRCGLDDVFGNVSGDVLGDTIVWKFPKIWFVP